MSAPHLPPKSCSVVMHERVRSLPALLLLILLAWLSGLSAALVAVVWVLPSESFVSVPSVYRSSFLAYGDGVIDIKDIDERMLRVYDSKLFSAAASYSVGSFLGEAPVLSSDGWSVLYLSTYVEGAYISLRAIDGVGNEHKPILAIYDNDTNLLYIKWEGSDFRAMSFGSEDVKEGSSVYFRENSLWRSTSVVYNSEVFASSAFASNDIMVTPVLTLSNDLSVGSPLVTSYGHLAGFSGVDRFVSSYYVRYALVQLLERGDYDYYYMPITGQFVDAVEIGSYVRQHFGLLVTKSDIARLLPGDIIVRVDGDRLDPFLLDMQLIVSNEKHILTVVRNGSEIIVPVLPVLRK